MDTLERPPQLNPHIDQATVDQKVDNAIRRVNLYPLDNAVGLPDTYQLDTDLPSGQRYPNFNQQLGSGQEKSCKKVLTKGI